MEAGEQIQRRTDRAHGAATLSGLMMLGWLTQGSRAFTAFRRGNPGLDETTPSGLIAAKPCDHQRR